MPEITLYCECCGKHITEKSVSKRFCNRSCSNKWVSNNFANTPEKREQKSKTLKSKTLKSKTLKSKIAKSKTSILHYCNSCGSLKGECKHPEICTSQFITHKSNNLKSLGFDFSTIGTEKIFLEYEKCKNILLNDYNNSMLSRLDILKKYNFKSDRTITLLFNFFGIKSRTFSESLINFHTKLGHYDSLSDREIYNRKCNFTFGFTLKLQGFELIKQYGIYHPVNNPNGVSRDHIVSKAYGWEHNIPPEIISSPANCIYMLQSDNVSKSIKCSITKEQLYERYELWKQDKPLPYVNSLP